MNKWLDSKWLNDLYITKKGMEYNNDRRGEKWTVNEEDLLLEELKYNKDIRAIAEKFGRTIGGIRARQKKMAVHMYNQSIEHIMESTRLSRDQIIQIIQENLQHMNKTPSSDAKIDALMNDIQELKKMVYDLMKPVADD